ncbi:phosphotransferase enzyme family-domain-containing protein [Staphylotrichum tortipilum]|uniref:Phosphotransferase enzyme family-domain-containing protein n=1 Tax=Staphylotrichum tortipilum TaxID=2831512 RepID=A0AAN6RPG6_9PEZI|nr:phosphotransferase enzyme family-domain-containing protein [Staphylotrichum longicolle]
MAWPLYLPDDRLKWTEGWDSHPVWPTEPDVSIIQDLIWSECAPSGSASSLKAQLEVDFLADGAHHKVYNVKLPGFSEPLIFRVAVPIDPVLKMESEVSSLRFLGEKTSVPIPKCLAWGPAADTELGYDWCLMEKLPGVELRSVWRKMPWERKLELTDRLADLLSQLWKPEHKFDHIGSIFALPKHVPDNTAADGATYMVGPAVDSCFFSGRRRYLHQNRGPFPSCRSWLDSLITLEKEVITTTKTLLDHKEDMTPTHLATDWERLVEDDLEIDDEDEFLEDYDEAIDTVQAYYKLLPELGFPHDPPAVGQPRFSLYHTDLRDANIFVDPETFDITGILDWESAMTLPDWDGRDYPLLLQAPDPFDENIPQIPSTYDEEDERYNPALVASRDRWELRLLRRRYDEALEKLGWKDWRPSSPAATAKKLFLEGLSMLSSDLQAAKKRLVWAQEALDDDKKARETGAYHAGEGERAADTAGGDPDAQA